MRPQHVGMRKDETLFDTALFHVTPRHEVDAILLRASSQVPAERQNLGAYRLIDPQANPVGNDLRPLASFFQLVSFHYGFTQWYTHLRISSRPNRPICWLELPLPRGSVQMDLQTNPACSAKSERIRSTGVSSP